MKRFFAEKTKRRVHASAPQKHIDSRTPALAYRPTRVRSFMETALGAYNRFFSKEERSDEREILRPKAYVTPRGQLKSNDEDEDEVQLSFSPEDGEVRMNLLIPRLFAYDNPNACAEIHVSTDRVFNVRHMLWIAIIPYGPTEDKVSIADFLADESDDPVSHASTWWGAIDVWSNAGNGMRADVSLDARVTLRILFAQLRYLRTLMTACMFVQRYKAYLRRGSDAQVHVLNALFKDDAVNSAIHEPDELLRRAIYGLLLPREVASDPIAFDCVELYQNHTDYIRKLSRDRNKFHRFSKDCKTLYEILTDIIEASSPWRALHPAAYEADQNYQFNNSIAPSRWVSVSLTVIASRARNKYRTLLNDVAFKGDATCGEVLSTVRSDEEFLATHLVYLDGAMLRIKRQDVLNELTFVDDFESFSFREALNSERLESAQKYRIRMMVPTLKVQVIVNNVPANRTIAEIMNTAIALMVPHDREAVRGVEHFNVYAYGYTRPLDETMSIGEIALHSPGMVVLTYLDPNWRRNPTFLDSI